MTSGHSNVCKHTSKNQKGFKVAIVLLNQSNLNYNEFTEIKISLTY